MKDAITKTETSSYAQKLLEPTLSLGVTEGNLTDSIGWGRCGWWVELDSAFKLPPFTTGIENTLLLIAHIRIQHF